MKTDIVDDVCFVAQIRKVLLDYGSLREEGRKTGTDSASRWFCVTIPDAGAEMIPHFIQMGMTIRAYDFREVLCCISRSG